MCLEPVLIERIIALWQGTKLHIFDWATHCYVEWDLLESVSPGERYTDVFQDGEEEMVGVWLDELVNNRPRYEFCGFKTVRMPSTVHRRLPRLVHVLRGGAGCLMVYLVCRESQGGGNNGARKSHDKSGPIPSQVRFADCS